MSYEIYSRYYDSLEGNQEDKVEILKNLFITYNSNAKDLLELACETGELLTNFREEYPVWGTYLSDLTFEIAKKVRVSSK